MIKPMLLEKTTKEEFFSLKDLPSWKDRHQANIKYDGERIIAVKSDGEVFLYNRRGRFKNSFYAEVVEDLKKIEGNFIVDGEIISLDDNFTRLQRRALTSNPHKQEQVRKEVPVKYMVFDILEFENINIEDKPLSERVEKLIEWFEFVFKRECIEMVIYEKDIKSLLELAEAENKEGIVIKDMDSTYEHRRSRAWAKLKFFKQTDLTLESYTINNAGIRAEDKESNVVQISGHQHHEVKDKIDNEGYCEVTCQYLEKTEKGRLRFPSYIKMKNG